MYYPRFQQERERFLSGRTKQFDDPVKQAAYDQETESLYNQLIRGIVGGGTNEAASIERALAANEFGDGIQGQEVPASYGLGGSRKLREGEQMPSGAYSLAKFPGIEHQIWAAEAGFLPRGYHWSSLLNESPDEKGRREQDQRKFAAYQKKLLGMDMAPQRGWRYRR